MFTAIHPKAVAKYRAVLKTPQPSPKHTSPPEHQKCSDDVCEKAHAAPDSGADAIVSSVLASAGIHFRELRLVPLWKRWLDLSCVLLSLPVTLPSMLAVIVWIKLVSRGPCLFRQERVGLNGKPFVLYKFRSMRVNADTRRHVSHVAHLVRSGAPMVKLDLMRDTRLIAGGCFLRAAGLDELPQLFNVLRGEMSLVGPRPCLPEELRFFSPKQRVRFEVLPGLTGMWQVHRKETGTFHDMNQMDACYVHQSSPSLDLRLMLRTPFVLLRQMRLAFAHCLFAYRFDPERSSERAISEFGGSRPG